MRQVRCFCDLQHELSAQSTREKGLSVAFVFMNAARNFGSVQVRSRELARLLDTFSPDLSVDSIPLEYYRGGADVIVASKTIVKVPGVERFLRREKKSGAVVLFDLVDGSPRSTRKIDRYIDAYLCSSHKEFEFREELGQKAFFIPHNVDERMEIRNETPSQFRVGYSGAPRNAQHLEELDITTYDSSSTNVGSDFDRLDHFLAEISHHYSVRQDEKRLVFKPGLKIYIAALYGRAFIGSIDDRETLEILGEDYPYLAQSSNLEDVERVINFARESFGGREHSTALSQLKLLRREFCPANIAQQLAAAISASLN